MISASSWKWLTLSVNDRRKIPIKLLVKTFSSGKPEKMVLKCLSDLGLCGDKFWSSDSDATSRPRQLVRLDS
ncbi:hypothetical protein COOONC_24820 [Cooperia oncophora]